MVHSTVLPHDGPNHLGLQLTEQLTEPLELAEVDSKLIDLARIATAETAICWLCSPPIHPPFQFGSCFNRKGERASEC